MKPSPSKRALSTSIALLLCLVAAAPAAPQSGLDLLDVDVIFVGAHPDDDSGVLATFARYLLDEGFTGTVVTATGGDGGGNAIGPEAGRSLALIRKEEERRALALVGVDAPSFLGLSDFYFTLSAEETEKKWGTSFVCDVVRHVRLQRPEVIVTMWPGPGTHGQHQMAARAATIAFEKAPDPDFCPELTTEENLKPFWPSKLYYAGREGPTTVTIETESFSRALNMRYADIKATAMAKYRSQGFDQFLKIPVDEARPERFMLVRSRVPVAEPETHLLGGALVAAGGSPAGVGLRVEPRRFEASQGRPVTVDVTIVNDTGEALSAPEIRVEPGDGWSASPPTTLPGELAPGEQAEASFELTAGTDAAVDTNARFWVSYSASLGDRPVEGRNAAWVRAVPPVRARFRPLYDVAGYREFARETRTEWVIETLPTRVPLVLGRESVVAIEVTNDGTEEASGTVSFSALPGMEVAGATPFRVGPGETLTLDVPVTLDARALPEGRHAAKLPVEVRATSGAHQSVDTGDVYALPFLSIPRLATPPVVDGDLSDMAAAAEGAIGPEDRWWRRPPDGPEDASASFRLAYDEEFLYAGVRVRDDAVVCNIAPDDVRAQLRSDAIGITIDPSGESRDTSTVIQAAAFPCTTDGLRRPRVPGRRPEPGLDGGDGSRHAGRLPAHGRGLRLRGTHPVERDADHPEAGRRDRGQRHPLRWGPEGRPGRRQHQRERPRLGGVLLGRQAGASLSVAAGPAGAVVDSRTGPHARAARPLT